MEYRRLPEFPGAMSPLACGQSVPKKPRTLHLALYAFHEAGTRSGPHGLAEDGWLDENHRYWNMVVDWM